jgi:hypothetical protein
VDDEEGDRVREHKGARAVTVVVPTYNGAAYIDETLESIRQQTTDDFEVVVVDDGSQDGTQAKVSAHPVGARLIEQPHLGVAVARNRGLAEARGRWITFLDQDDLWHPTRLSRLLDWLGEHPSERLVATTELKFSTLDETTGLSAADPLVGHWADLRVPREGAYEALCGLHTAQGSDAAETYDHRALLRGPITVTTSFIADPEILRLAGGFAPHASAHDDYCLLVNAARLAPVVRVDQPTVFYRVHLGATSRSTRLALPFLATAVALRFGGGLIPVEEALDPGTTGPLHEHLLDEVTRSKEYADPRVRKATGHLAELLFEGGARDRRARALLRLRAPRTTRSLSRLRRRLRGDQAT